MTWRTQIWPEQAEHLDRNYRTQWLGQEILEHQGEKMSRESRRE
jgi:hypothetical protein